MKGRTYGHSRIQIHLLSEPRLKSLSYHRDVTGNS